MNRRASYPLIALVAFGSLAAPAFVFASFDQDLHYGITGSEQVLDLQDFLISQDLYKGTVTGNYFSMTVEAVKAFQVQEGIDPALGYFGSVTRQRANEILLDQGTHTGPAADASSTNANSTGTTGTTTDIADLTQKYADLLQRVMNIQSALDALSTWAAGIEQTINSLLSPLSPSAPPLPPSSPSPAPAPAKTATTTTTAPKPATTTATTTAPTTVKTATTTTPLH